MSSEELELLLFSPGEKIEAQDKRTSHRWHGRVDIIAPE
jgi:hypothetical protein